jgi:nitrogen fixation protein FixH
MEHSANSLDFGSNSTATDKNESEATEPSASSAFAKDEAFYMPTSTSGWRCMESIDKKTVTFASNPKEGSIITADYESGDIAMRAEDKQKGEMTAVVEEVAGRSIGYFAMTDGGPTSSWHVDKGESPYYQLVFYEVTEVGNLAVEKENESLTNHLPMEHSANSLDVSGDGAAEDTNDSKATRPSASSAFAKDEASYMPASTPGWRCMESIDRKTVTFTSNAKESSIITADYESGDLAMSTEDKQKEEMMAVVEENAGRSIGYFAMTDGELISSWNFDKGESLISCCSRL